MHHMKKFYRILIVYSMLLSVLLGCVGCAGTPPRLEEIYDRVVELIEASYELNEIFYGEGLPYYDRELPVYHTLYSNYTIEGYTKDYHIVSSNAKFHSVEEIKSAAEQVYSSGVLETVYAGMFDGLVITNEGSGYHSSPARYIQDNEYLYILIEEEGKTHPTPLMFDYSTMKIINPSNDTTVLITMDAWEEDSPDNVFEMRLSIINENGVWLLNKLTV